MVYALLAIACTRAENRNLEATSNEAVSVYSITGVVDSSGPANSYVVLGQGSDTLTVRGSNKFTFVTPLSPGQRYNVVILGTSPGLACAVSQGSGVMSSTPVTNVQVHCAPPIVYTWPFDAGTSSAYVFDAPLVFAGGTIAMAPGDSTPRAVYATTPVAYSHLYKLDYFTGAPGCPRTFFATFSPDAITWYYYTALHWTVANGTLNQSMNARDITPALLSSYTNFVGPGSLYVKTFLSSDGNTPCSLDAINVTYDQNASAPVAHAAAYLTVSGYVTPRVAGAAGTVTVTAYGSNGAVATDYAGTVVLTSTDLQASLGVPYTFSASDAGVAALPATMFTVGVQALAAHDSNFLGVSGTQTGIVVQAGAAAHLRLTGYPSPQSAGTQGNVLIRAVDDWNNLAVGYTGQVHLTSDDPNAILSSNYTFTAMDAGVHVLQATFNEAGYRALAAQDVVNPNIYGFHTSIDILGRFSLGGSISGLLTNTNVTLTNGNDVVSATNGPYTFPTGVTYGQPYSIAITNPAGQTCAFNPNTAGNGNMPGAPVTNANVLCTPNAFPLGGSIVGVVNTNVTLVNTSNADTIHASNGNFVFDQNVAYGSNYNVTFTAPTGLNCNITQASGIMPAAANNNVVLTCSIVYVFTSATNSNYIYDSNFVAINANVASLAPLFALQADVNTTNFTAGSFSGTVWDANNQYLRLSFPPASTSYLAYLPLEIASNYSANVVDPNLGVNNVGGYKNCSSAVVGQVSQTLAHTGISSFQLAGNALDGNAYAFLELVNLQNQNITINANSWMTYWLYPTGYHASGTGAGVNGNNSMYVALDLFFTDGSDTRTVSTLKDDNNVVFSPQAQGAGGYLALDQWNYVKVELGALAGKVVQRIDAGWQNPNVTLGFETYIDDIMLAETIAQPPINHASLDASWTPQYASLAGYWAFEGTGAVANGDTVAATVGGNLVAHNSNGSGFTYIHARVGQGLFFDGVDDALSIPTSNFPNATSMSIAAWVQGVYAGYDCPVLLSIGTSGSQGLEVGPYCGGLSGIGPFFFDSQSESVQAAVVPSGTWSHVVYTFDGTSGSMRVYLDGVLSNAGTFTTPLSSYFGTTPMIGAGTVCCTGPLHGIVDELAVWGTVLSANDVATLYDRQAPAAAGTFTSRVMKSPFTLQAPMGMEWNTTLPFYKPMVGNGNDDAPASYPAVIAGLSDDIVVYWNFDETAIGGAPGGGDFADSSGNGYTGYLGISSGPYPAPGNPGRFNNSLYFNVNLDVGVWESTPFNNPQVFTLQAWFKTNSNGGLVQFSDTFRNYPPNYDRLLYVGASGLLNFGINSSNYLSVLSSRSAVNDDQWHHAVGTLDASGNQSLYIDGVLAQAATGMSAQFFSGYWNAGFTDLYGWPDASRFTYFGYLDEVAVWNRALSANEVLQLYRRGADRQKLQLRTCATSNCADNPNWLGPDGTAYTYFSELDNIVGDAALPTSPNLLLTNFVPALSINTNNAYVQYRSILESDDTQQACTYGGSASPCSPELTSLGLYQASYAIGQSVTLHTGALSYATLSGVVTMLGTAGCSQGVTYALSPDGTSWYWYSSGWVASNGTAAQSNTLAQLTPSVMAAFVTAQGPGQAYFKAFLNSQGTSPCSLASVMFNP